MFSAGAANYFLRAHPGLLLTSRWNLSAVAVAAGLLSLIRHFGFFWRCLQFPRRRASGEPLPYSPRSFTGAGAEAGAGAGGGAG